MKADELLRISIENQSTIEEIIKICEMVAKDGQTFTVNFKYISTETISQLGGMGFRVRKTTGQVGEPVFVISWD